MGRRDDALEGRPSRRSQPLEARELRLHRNAGRAGRRDQADAVGRDRVRGSRPWIGGFARLGLEPRWIGVEAEADLATPLLDEGGEPVGEGSQRASP
jgi:hypothetical protein